MCLGSVAQGAPILNDNILPGQVVALEPVVTVDRPNSLGHAGDGTGRLFVSDQDGILHLLEGDELAMDPFLDVGALGIPIATSGERGLLGFAFHPNFAEPSATPGSGLLYTYTSEARAGTADFSHPELDAGNRGNHHTVIREWTVSATDPSRVDTSVPSRVLMRINQPQGNHNGGDLAFGQDGNLYISLGDGGGSNDASGGAQSPTDGHTNTLGNSQDLSNIYGTILRIDPLGTNAGGYGVPGDNPFVGSSALDEIYAYGLRNPFRISFDRETGDLYAGDVGQGAREEIDEILPGLNYGWVFREGSRVNRQGGPADTEPPVGEYTRTGDNRAVIGGFVYRGSEIVGLTGKYVFGDLGASLGKLYYLDLETGEIREFQLTPGSAAVPGRLNGLGEDASGELYYLFGSGEVMRLIVPEPSSVLLVALGLAGLALRKGSQRPGLRR